MRNCPKCGDEINISARACGCGWKSGGGKYSEAVEDKRCSYQAMSSRCEFPGSIETNGTRRCRFHDGSRGHQYGAAIIEESQDWRRKINAGVDVEPFLTSESGQKIPNYTNLGQREKMREVDRQEWLAENGAAQQPGESNAKYATRLQARCKGSFRLVIEGKVTI